MQFDQFQALVANFKHSLQMTSDARAMLINN